MNGTATRRRLLQGLGVLVLPGAAAASACAWPAWTAFRRVFIRDGGRVAEPLRDGRTVSEAQAYAMFFALVANEPDLFERLLRWTEDNLAGGDLTQRLPAWHWGRRDDGRWGVIDDNAAADADLWMAYTLGEAGRLWRQRRYSAMAALLAERIVREETAELPGLGPTLLPGPRGFVLDGGRWKLNPSYLPPLQLRWFARRFGGAWTGLLASALQLLRASAPMGFAPDWVVYDGERFAPGEGSYDAIRVYLWLGLGGAPDSALRANFAPMAVATEKLGLPPEKVDPAGATPQGDGPAGFSAALLPFLQAQGATTALRAQLQRLASRPPQPEAYYDQVLTLFGQGAIEARYGFDAHGQLLPAWATGGACVAVAR